MSVEHSIEACSGIKPSCWLNAFLKFECQFAAADFARMSLTLHEELTPNPPSTMAWGNERSR